MDLTDFRTLGRSGLAVSPLALGTMTFGTARWGSSDDVSEAVFRAYVESGGNFIDTADVYAGGHSEEVVGRLIERLGLRDGVVLATKATFGAGKGNPNAGGNGRKHLRRALEGSLRRLRTDHVDLYWLHAWDGVTPAEEVMQTLGDLVRAGMVRYFALSNVPAWYAARAVTLAGAHGQPGPVALQLEYSLVERHIEWEHVPAARELGLGITPWSPLAGGFLAGKYTREAERVGGEGRLSGKNPFGDTKFTPQNWRALAALREVAAQVERSPAQVALAWTLAQPGITAPILGASRPAQLRDNVASLGLHLTPEQLQLLDERSAPERVYPYTLFTDGVRRSIFDGTEVTGWR